MEFFCLLVDFAQRSLCISQLKRGKNTERDIKTSSNGNVILVARRQDTSKYDYVVCHKCICLLHGIGGREWLSFFFMMIFIMITIFL